MKVKTQAKVKTLIFNGMKNRKFKIVVAIALIMTASCNEPETVVTDIIHPDGSVTRRIEMKNEENKFSVSNVQVPYDDTWIVKDSLEVNEKGDTIWVKRAEKLFKSSDEINRDYKADSSYNRGISRSAAFSKKFKWFHTNYRFAEKIDRKLKHGYPVSDFLNKEELSWFYLPEDVRNKKENSQDSLKFNALKDSVRKKSDMWFTRNFISEWINEFGRLTNEKSSPGIDVESLKAREDEFMKVIEKINEREENFDSLWNTGTILRDYIGEANAVKFKPEADSALKISTNSLFISFRNYTIKIIMPGKVTGTNGFIDSTQVLLWPVQSDYFLTEPYEMWAESKVPNLWAWIVSGLFVLFAFTGVLVTRKGKG